MVNKRIIKGDSGNCTGQGGYQEGISVETIKGQKAEEQTRGWGANGMGLFNKRIIILN